MVALGIVAARLDYCNSPLYVTTSDNLRKLQVTQNALARVVCQAARHCSATKLHRRLHWLPVKQRVDYKLAVLTYRARQRGSPWYLASLISDYVSSRSLRPSDKLLLSRPYTSVVMADKAFSVSPPKIWNNYVSILYHLQAKDWTKIAIFYFFTCSGTMMWAGERLTHL